MNDNFTEARRKMVESQIMTRDISDQRVVKAMLKVQRHHFVSQALQHRAYINGALPIDENQTISQPYIVAKMTEALQIRGGEKVLEIGTGSGYQAAVLAEMDARVFTVERFPKLATQARRRLENAGYQNVLVIAGDGTMGWPEFAPYDRIIVTAGAPSIPDKLTAQLKNGGIMVIPVGGKDSQRLKIITRRGDTAMARDSIGCVFVPLIGLYGWKKEDTR